MEIRAEQRTLDNASSGTHAPPLMVSVLAVSALAAGYGTGGAHNQVDNTMTTNNVDIDPGRYPAVLQELDEKDGGGWLASYPDLPGCFGHGATQMDALQDGNAAVVLWIKAHAARDITIPLPKATSSRSGHIRVRVPKVLHRHLQILAETVLVSLNALVVLILQEEMGLLIETDDAAQKTPNTVMTGLDAVAASIDRMATSFAEQGSVAKDGTDLFTWTYDHHDRYAGEWVQRLDSQLHHHLWFRAAEQGISVNTLIVALLGLGVGRREGAILVSNSDKGRFKTAA